MKIKTEIECSPEEARKFLGLPDVGKANDLYVDTVTKAMKGVSNPEQLQDFARQLAPMGTMGLKMFQGFVEAGTQGFNKSSSKKDSGKKKSDD